MGCLIVERHPWETGAGRQQLQIPKAAFSSFFAGPGKIEVDIYGSPWLTKPTRTITAQVSAYKKPSGTYRLNKIFEIANVGHVFILMQDAPLGTTGLPRYELWWERDVALVASRFKNWTKAKDSQYGRGRVWTIAKTKVQRPFGW